MTRTQAQLDQLAAVHAGWQHAPAGRAHFSRVGLEWQASPEGRAETEKQLGRMHAEPAIILRRKLGQSLHWAALCDAKGRTVLAVWHLERAEGYRRELAGLSSPALGSPDNAE